MLYIIISILTVILIILSYFIYNLLNQINQLESEIIKHDEELSSLETEVINHYKFFLGIFTEAFVEMNRVDRRGSFSSDDEVGFAFKVIYSAIENVKEKLRIVTNEAEEEQKQST